MTSMTSPTRFSWTRALIWTAATAAIWMACALVVRLVADWAQWTWVQPSFPGLAVALGCGVAIEYLRLSRARRRTS